MMKEVGMDRTAIRERNRIITLMAEDIVTKADSLIFLGREMNNGLDNDTCSVGEEVCGIGVELGRLGARLYEVLHFTCLDYSTRLRNAYRNEGGHLKKDGPLTKGGGL